MKTEPYAVRFRMLRRSLSLVVVVLWSLAPVRADEAAKPDPKAILRATARAYSTAQTLQVRVDTEIPLPPGKPHVLEFAAHYRDGMLVMPVTRFHDPLWRAAHEWRIVRGQALRVRITRAGGRGVSISHFPDRTIQVGYDTGRTDEGPALEPVRTFANADGKVNFEDFYMGVLGAPADLPFKLFFARQPEKFLAAEKVEYLRAASEAGRACDVLQLTVGHTIMVERVAIGSHPSPFRKRTLLSATWTLWIDHETALIHRAEIRERWRWGSAEDGSDAKERLLEIRETYRDQRINLPLAVEDFLPEPLDPVQPVETQSKHATEPAAPTPGTAGEGAQGRQ